MMPSDQIIVIKESGSWLITVSSTMIGFLGSLAAFYVKDLYTGYTQLKKFAATLLAEVEGIERQYLEVTFPGMKESVETHGVFSIIITEDYFTVFNHNTDKLGMLSKGDGAAVVRAYVAAKGFIDTLRIVTAAVDKVSELMKAGMPHGQAHLMLSQLKIQCRMIVDDHYNILGEVNAVKQILNKYVNLSFNHYVSDKLPWFPKKIHWRMKSFPATDLPNNPTSSPQKREA